MTMCFRIIKKLSIQKIWNLLIIKHCEIYIHIYIYIYQNSKQNWCKFLTI